MKRPRVYLDTSVLNFFIAKQRSEKKSATQELFKLIRKEEFDPIISTTVLAEIARAPRGTRNSLEKLVQEFELTVVEDNIEVIELANKYIKAGIILKGIEGMQW